MADNKNPALEMFRKKFETYRKVMDAEGEQKAWDTLFAGYPERQKKNMGPMIEGVSLAKGFSTGIEKYKQIGMEMEVIDISNAGMDAVLEVQKVCPVLGMSKEYGFEKPCHIICDMDIEATKAAFPGMHGARLSAKAEGSAVCIFKYERKAK